MRRSYYFFTKPKSRVYNDLLRNNQHMNSCNQKKNVQKKNVKLHMDFEVMLQFQRISIAIKVKKAEMHLLALP